MVEFQCYLMHVWWNFWWWSHSSSNSQNYFSFLDFICFSCYSSNTHLYREVAFSSRLRLLLFYLSWDSCHFSFFLLWILHRKSSSIFIATFRTKIVQTLHEFQNQFIYYSREFLKKLKWNFHSFFFPCASNQSWACLPMLSTVPKCKCFTQIKKWWLNCKIFCKIQLFFHFWATEIKCIWVSDAFWGFLKKIQLLQLQTFRFSLMFDLLYFPLLSINTKIYTHS